MLQNCISVQYILHDEIPGNWKRAKVAVGAALPLHHESRALAPLPLRATHCSS
jgi:hypothetical protein